MMNKELYYLIDTDLTLYTIKGKAIKDCFDKCISPLDIVSQVGNETQAELVHELRLQYVKDLENGLMNALDKLSIYHNLLSMDYDDYDDLDLEQYDKLMFENVYGEQRKKDFDYYDMLRELTEWGNYQALDFLDMFGDNEDE